MSFAKPEYSRSEVRRAGEILKEEDAERAKAIHAYAVMANWRAAHAYPLNTFQSTLRNKLRGIDSAAVVGQRLKRAPSIIAKLNRFDSMKLNQMQDIAGLRAIVGSIAKLKKVHSNYQETRFRHELIKTNDYIASPKADGYRSIHLVYRYFNSQAPEYDNLHVELQLRTHLQHAWATAVETVDAFLGESIKAGKPGEKWAEFFRLASAVFSESERSPVVGSLATVAKDRLLKRLDDVEKALDVALRLRGFTVAANQITRTGNPASSYHLIVLNTRDRKLSIKSFPLAEQARAHKAYANQELLAKKHPYIDPVLVMGGNVSNLRKSYPNYFLDTRVFVQGIDKILGRPR